MLRSIPILRPDRRHVALAVAVIAALLVAALVTVDRSTTSRDAVIDRVDEGGSASSAFDGPITRNEARDEAIAPDARAGAAADVEASMAPGDDVAIEPPVTRGGLDAPSLDPKIVRMGSIDLLVPRRSFENAWGDAHSVATSLGGYVVAASRSGASDDARAGTITMRVPTAKFEAAVDSLRGIDAANVERLDVTSQDVTQEFVDVRSRLRHDRAVERRLMTLLADADGVSEVLAVQARLDGVQEQIEVARGRLQYLEKMTAMSTIETTISAPSKSGARADEPSDHGIVEALVEARDRFVGNVAAIIVWFGGALPALVLLGSLAFVGRSAWRRRSTQSPDQAA